MRADRLLQIVALLRRHGRLPAARLAELLEVSERTILRDMESLSAAGVPVYAERGRHGGCVLLGEFRTDVGGLTPREAQALFAWTSGGPASVAGELGLGGELGTALTKLAATVPAPAMQEADALASVVIVDRRRWFSAAEEVPLLPVLRRAAMERRRVRLRYQSAGRDRPGVRTVDPYGLVENAGRWYLLAVHRGAVRSYRVSRISGATVLDAPADVPDDFDLAEVWAGLRGRLERDPGSVTLEVAIDPTARDLFTQVSRFQLVSSTDVEDLGTARGIDSDEAWPVLRLTFRARRAAVSTVLGFGGEVRVLGPDDVREEVCSRARATLAAHAAEAAC